MTTITIPKELTKMGDLVLIPKKEYEEFLKLREKKEWKEKGADEAIKIRKKENSARVFRELKESQKEISTGKGKILKSLKDLR